ncbi:DUF6090 family protein [Bacteroidota bacterium]|nr:DUF6090 family protein [Bacteroidota bacterium]
MRFLRFEKIFKLVQGKYLRYAIGEIILVVIGILIALQVNNLNEERKLRIQEKNVLLNKIKFFSFIKYNETFFFCI